uniref:Uncharacterized protein n=1 Tax=Zea mays TaxID=4577 RepID=C4IY61_MAIZE|nr:unknown [Zea mays]
MYRSQQTFPSTTIRDDRSIAAPAPLLPPNKHLCRETESSADNSSEPLPSNRGSAVGLQSTKMSTFPLSG